MIGDARVSDHLFCSCITSQQEATPRSVRSSPRSKPRPPGRKPSSPPGRFAAPGRRRALCRSCLCRLENPASVGSRGLLGLWLQRDFILATRPCRIWPWEPRGNPRTIREITIGNAEGQEGRPKIRLFAEALGLNVITGTVNHRSGEILSQKQKRKRRGTVHLTCGNLLASETLCSDERLRCMAV